MQIKQNQKKKIPDISKLVKKSDYNARVSEIEGKIPSISGLVAISALNAVENKIPSFSNLVKKTDQTQRLVNLKKNLLVIIMINMLQFQNLIS